MNSDHAREIRLQYKGNRCHACGVGISEMVEKYGTSKRLFEFNHVDPPKKHPNCKNVIRRQVLSTEQVDELDKCVLLCDRCHNILTAQNLRGTLELTVRRGNRKAMQRFDCQLIIDYETRRIKFLSADRHLLDAYRVRVGFHRPKLMFCTELAAHGALSGLISSLRNSRRIIIERWATGELMALAEHISDAKYRLTSSVGFNVLSFNLCGEGPDTPLAWIRNGLALSKDGVITPSGTVTCIGRYDRIVHF